MAAITTMGRRCRRRSDDRVVAGVAGGLADYLGMNPWAVRSFLLFVAVVPPNIGLLLYPLLWWVVPCAPADEPVIEGVGAPMARVERVATRADPWLKRATKLVGTATAVVSFLIGGGKFVEQVKEAGKFFVPADSLPPAPAPPAAARPNRLEAELASVLAGAGAAEASAMLTLDPRQLRAVYAGQQLVRSLASLDTLRAARAFAVATLVQRRLGDVTVTPDSLEALVHMTERWRVELRAQGQCRLLPEWDSPQLVHLIRRDGRWIIDVVAEQGAPPDSPPRPC